METLHKLAGVQDASDLQLSSHERPSQPQVVIPEPPPIPDSDNDPYSGNQQSQRGSRASLPLNRQGSRKSMKSSKSRSRSNTRRGDGQSYGGVGVLDKDYPPVPTHVDAEVDGALQGHGLGRRSQETEGSATTATTEDFTWGPSHPCFPHPNPHCLPESEEGRSTRVIRVRRDWLASGDLYPQYANLYPEILDPLVSDADFRFLVSNINSRLKTAFSPYTTRAWVDTVLGLLTGWLWDDLGFNGVKRGEKGLEAFLEHWNQGKVEEGKTVRVVQLRRTGFTALDFVIPDPGIDALENDEGEGEEERSRRA